ncbi:50S ribosomal protein L6 [Haloquadratum walsbyi]|jgi:LSU ribosomal protein L6P|uniref:Large ribosomal subunit protein uL6 n=1 Tax=Haloquadratum walsbyi J07HQW2 TaxID=1238425 RepID=U1NE62_9EURY|nr:50S ribosomal protein L6 [Haloquadratum walsbyi]ERG95038.1 MAG: archaeal ribosomal protein L6P [Haloquadratum walsbyi J07HQW2]
MTRTVIEIPEDVSAEVSNLELTVEGPNGSVTRMLWYPSVTVSVDDDDDVVTIETDETDAKTSATVGTFESHVSNMIHGVTDGWSYEMEVYYAHFPMQVSVDGEEIIIENFLGERASRRTSIRGDTDVQIDGETVTLTGPSKEDVGQTAADIEQLTRVTDKDSRIFQDGVYITQKPQQGGV